MTEKLTKMTVDQLKYFEYLCNKIDLDWQYYDNNEEGTCTLVLYWWDWPFGDYIEWLTEQVEVECHFEDEVDTCENCHKAVEIIPSHYGWTPNYMRDESWAPICRECIENDEDLQGEFIELLSDHHFHNKPRAILDWFRPIAERNGFRCLEDDDMACKRYETGFYPDQKDDPNEIIKWMEENLPDHEFLFCVDSVGQFDIHFSALLRPKND